MNISPQERDWCLRHSIKVNLDACFNVFIDTRCLYVDFEGAPEVCFGLTMIVIYYFLLRNFQQQQKSLFLNKKKMKHKPVS